jgi:uncharacterized protein (TIGR01777 family)
MKILVCGATGLIGRSVCKLLAEDGHHVSATSRSANKPSGLAAKEVHQWDPHSGPPSASTLDGIEAIVNLVGESIDARRWSDDQKKLIRDSRVVTTRNLVDGLRSLGAKPAVLVNGSAVGYYGNRGDEILEETASSGRGFMSDVCQEWEREAQRATDIGIRLVQVRTGVVLSGDGGALKKMLLPFKIGIGGRLGNGKQWFPWIHIDDIAGIFRHAVINSSVRGPMNGVAPNPVTNAEFTRELARALHRPAFFPVPEISLKVLLGEMSEVLFDSQRAVPSKAIATGYKFVYPDLASALKDLLD